MQEQRLFMHSCSTVATEVGYITASDSVGVPAHYSIKTYH